MPAVRGFFNLIFGYNSITKSYYVEKFLTISAHLRQHSHLRMVIMYLRTADREVEPDPG